MNTTRQPGLGTDDLFAPPAAAEGPVKTVFEYPIVRCSHCGMQFLQVRWLAHRVAGFCMLECQEAAR